MDNNFIVRCSQCGAKNRVSGSRSGQAVCGRCKSRLDLSILYPDRPIDVSDSTFSDEVVRFAGPALVEFSAPW
jgi:transcription elongation factor Elf1